MRNESASAFHASKVGHLVRGGAEQQPYPIPGSRYVGGYIGVGLERQYTDKSNT